MGSIRSAPTVVPERALREPKDLEFLTSKFPKSYSVYVLATFSRKLYVGVTNDFDRAATKILLGLHRF